MGASPQTPGPRCARVL